MSLYKAHNEGKEIGVACGEYRSSKEIQLRMRKGLVKITIAESGKELASIDIGFRFFYSMASELFKAFYGED